MSENINQIVEQIHKILEHIESADLDDCEAWKEIHRELETAMAQIPLSMADQREVWDLCDQALTFLSRNSAKGFLSLVEAVFEGLTTSAGCLSAGSDPEGGLEKAKAVLHEAMKHLPDTGGHADGSPGSGQGNSGAETRHAPASLDDAAALLVQMEPNDLSDMPRLVALLRDLAQNESCPEPARGVIAEAASRAEILAGGGDPASEEALARIGRLLEKAMDAIGESEAISRSRPTNAEGALASDEDMAVPNQDPEARRASGPSEVPDLQSLPEDADRELIAEFVSESSDLIEAAEEALLALESDPEDMESVSTVFRAFHTVKGGSAFLELMAISQMAHHAESLLSRVRDREIRYAGGYADLALRALDMIKNMIQVVQGALEGEPLFKPEGYDELLELLANPEEAGISEEYGGEETASPPRIGDLLVAAGKADRKQVEEAAASKDEKPIGVKIAKSKAAKVADVAQALRTQRTMQGRHAMDSSVRVSTSRLDRLIDLVGELVIAHSMVAQDKTVVNGDNYDLLKKVSQTSKIVRELQTLGMSMRMIPLRGTFKKMARLVRDISRKMGKNVSLATEGEDTEIDRNMVDIINDPLMHMVRNSVDHGIESPDERERLGKPRQGLIRLSAYHSAGNVVVEIADDGRGLNRDLILAKAREKGILAGDVSLTEREIFNLIFEPGFSTAKEVTDVSGRGVGMDVVKKNIESLRGQVEIDSEAGKGSVFRMSLPLTLAIIDGMVVRVGSETYIIPTASIVRSVKPEKRDLSTVLNRGEMLSLQGSLLPLIQLGKLFRIDGFDGERNDKLVVVVEDDAKKQAGLVIDDLVGRQQIVIKSLGEGMKNIPGISGGAIMPDGRVGLILDVGGVVKAANAATSL
ncbi:MAG: chemotaxis protein CheA [Deltaproteobacteria bacterium]|nr:chemotaxis protein CheA [Deltaproteobacteria bacterium]